MEIGNIPKASFGTTIYVRPYAVLEDDTVVYGAVASISVNSLLG